MTRIDVPHDIRPIHIHPLLITLPKQLFTQLHHALITLLNLARALAYPSVIHQHVDVLLTFRQFADELLNRRLVGRVEREWDELPLWVRERAAVGLHGLLEDVLAPTSDVCLFVSHPDREVILMH